MDGETIKLESKKPYRGYCYVAKGRARKFSTSRTFTLQREGAIRQGYDLQILARSVGAHIMALMEG